MKYQVNEIIPKDDFRYGKLGHLWRRYNFLNLISKEGKSSLYYYVPPELVKEEYFASSIVTKHPKDEWDNWIYNRDASRILNYTTGMTLQDYFDLLILKINNRSDRPKCKICGNPIGFYSVYYGYGSPYTSWIDKFSLSCSKSCSNKLRWSREDDYFNSEEFRNILSETASNLIKEGVFKPTCISKWVESNKEQFRERKSSLWRDPYYSTYLHSRLFKSRGDLDDECVFYVAITKSKHVKIGVTQDLNSRYISSYKEDAYKIVHPILVSTREEVANLESKLKLKNDGSEYFLRTDLNYVFNLIRFYLTTRPVGDPFD